MPWQEESTMELRRQFIQDVQSGATPVTELCTAYQISRKTGYKWLARYEAGGLPARSLTYIGTTGEYRGSEETAG